MLQKSFTFFCLLFSMLTSAQIIDVQHYHFEIGLSDANDSIVGKATLNIKFQQPSQQFFLQLKNVASGKGMQVKSVSGNNVQGFQHASDKIAIGLKNVSSIDSIYTYVIHYTGVPADGLIIAKNKWGDRTFFSDNWPNRAQHWLPTNDTPADKASVEFKVTAPVHYQIISNGVQVEESNLTNGQKLTHWKESIPIPTKVMVIGAARFAVKNYVDSTAGNVSAWVYPQDSAKGYYDYALAPSILQFFNNYVGAYAFSKLANVQSKTIFGGMENASAIFYNETSVTGNRASEGLLAHEIAHQWFGNMATEKSFAHLWLSEGFASYLTHIYLENRYGADTLMKGLKDDRTQVIDFAKKWKKPVVDTASGLMQLLNANSYQKGSWVLHMLRNEVGDATFKKIISAYYAQYKGSNADTKDFQKVAEKVSGKNLDLFFQQWLFTVGHPQLQVQWKQAKDGIAVTLKQLQPIPFSFPLSLGIHSQTGALPIQKIRVTKKEETFVLKGYTNIQQIVLDPFTQLLFEGTVTKGK